LKWQCGSLPTGGAYGVTLPDVSLPLSIAKKGEEQAENMVT
jgi:hypothetical protein